MTYQQPTHTHNDDDNAEEASPLLTIVIASPAPSLSFGQGGVATKKKNGGVPRRLMIATACFFLGTLAVLYGGRGGRSHIRSDGTLDALLLGHNYDPNSDHCFTDEDNPGKYCWFHKEHIPCGNWIFDGKHGNNNCGPKCTQAQRGLDFLHTSFCGTYYDDDDQ